MRLRKQIIATLLAFCCGSVLAANPSDNVVEARGVIKQFAKSLMGQLKPAMKEGGPIAAIQVCNARAPDITKEISATSGWRVARTSLKSRNVSNAPDAWELNVLNAFESRKAAGEDPKKIDYSEVVEVAGQKSFRYMKAIPTAKLCLGCHGSDIKPVVTQKLDELYPHDKARGFKAGDIRGAFTLSKAL
ncbi:MAG: DUF3365 domain-containing protein [Sedimenticola sp.]